MPGGTLRKHTITIVSKFDESLAFHCHLKKNMFKSCMQKKAWANISLATKVLCAQLTNCLKACGFSLNSPELSPNDWSPAGKYMALSLSKANTGKYMALSLSKANTEKYMALSLSKANTRKYTALKFFFYFQLKWWEDQIKHIKLAKPRSLDQHKSLGHQ